MKNILFALLLLLITTNIHAKKVKFACDMTGIPIMSTGMHISGDFQTLAGFPGGDWNSASTPLTQEAGTDIYSIIVDIPAFAKYEYKFVNGDQFYEAEFVPEYSRVGYNFNDNRWLYVDSISDDTTFVGAIVFAENAPAGLTLVRFYVDMNGQTVSPNGVHLAGNFQGWNPASIILYSFFGATYEVIGYLPAGTHEYRFYNGNTSGSGELVPSACQVNGNREITVSADVLLDVVCYASCFPCLTALAENNISLKLNFYPNPSSGFSNVSFSTQLSNATIRVADISGRIVREYHQVSEKTLTIEKGTLNSGLYFVSVIDKGTPVASSKLIFN